MLTGFVHTVHQLYIVRFLLGLAEAGYFPGMALYLTYWFPQREQARALALLIAAIPVATILGAPVSGLILDHVHWLGVSSWRWLLILEAMPAIVGGVLTYFLLPSKPQEAGFLTADEKDWIRAELGRACDSLSSSNEVQSVGYPDSLASFFPAAAYLHDSSSGPAKQACDSVPLNARAIAKAASSRDIACAFGSSLAMTKRDLL